MTVFRIRHERRGGHIHMRLFSAKQPNMTFAKLGDLCCAEGEFLDLQLAMSGVAFRPEEPHEVPVPEDEP